MNHASSSSRTSRLFAPMRGSRSGTAEFQRPVQNFTRSANDYVIGYLRVSRNFFTSHSISNSQLGGKLRHTRSYFSSLQSQLIGGTQAKNLWEIFARVYPRQHS